MSTYEEITDKFLQWLPTASIELANRVKITDSRSENQGRAMVSIADIQKGQRLFCVPNESLLNVVTGALGKSDDSIMHALLHKVEHWEGLVLTILYELKHMGPKSKWWPYLQILPSDLNTLLYWSDEELESLKPSLVLTRLGRDQSKKMFESVLALIEKFNIGEKIGPVSYEEFQRVASWIMAYSFDKEISLDEDDDDDEDEEDLENGTNMDIAEDDVEADAEKKEPTFPPKEKASSADTTDKTVETNGASVEDEDPNVENSIGLDGVIKCMIAVADILNSDTNLVNANIIYDHTGLVCVSTKDITAGEQIFNIYGEHPNAEILRRYGYVEWSGSKYDFGEVTMENIIEAVSEKFQADKTFLTKAVELLRDPDDDRIKQIWDYEEVALESFDCYSDGEILPEAVSTCQILSVLAQTPDIAKMNQEDLVKHVHRTVKKCQQLLDGGRVAASVDEIWKRAVAKRLNAYPAVNVDFSACRIKEAYSGSKTKQRNLMAACVLACEKKAIELCTEGVTKQFKLIPDEKLVSNILKRPNEGQNDQKPKKSRIVKRPRKQKE